MIAESERRAGECGRLLHAVGVRDDDPDARRLYERLGYRATGIGYRSTPVTFGLLANVDTASAGSS